jgi:hypothetical protein
MVSITYRPSKSQFHSVSFQTLWSAEIRISDGTGITMVLQSSRFRLNSSVRWKQFQGKTTSEPPKSNCSIGAKHCQRR